jgi:hypothetical protein
VGLARRVDLAHGPEAAAAGADHELADAGRTGNAAMVLRREPLIVVIVARQHDVGTGCLEGPPEGVGSRIVRMQSTRAEPAWCQ